MSTRELKLNRRWSILTDPDSVGIEQEWFKTPPNEGWRSIRADHAWQHVLGIDYHGVAWYRRRARLPKNWFGKDSRIWLRVESVATDCTVWVNGIEATKRLLHDELGLDVIITHATFDSYKAADVIVGAKMPVNVGPRMIHYERETGIDYWVDAITNRGLAILRDDFLGVCKFSGMSDENMVQAIGALTGLAIDVDDIQRTIRRVFLRGYKLEQMQGFTEADYVLPADTHREYPQIELPHFNTPEFFAELKQKVTARLDEMLAEECLV